MPIEQLERAAVGRPITRVGVSLFPVYLPGAHPIDIAPSSDALEISELDDAHVPTLTVTNRDLRPVLLVEGETVVGGQQNRTLNVSVLVPAGATIAVPVSCVEAGRWDGRAEFARGRTYATRRVRRTKQATVASNLRLRAEKATDQGAVWSTIDSELDRLDARNPSAAFHAAESVIDDRGHALGRAADELVALGPLPGQCGVVVAHGGRIVAAEILASPELLAATWEPLIRATLLDAPVEREGPTVGEPCAAVPRSPGHRPADRGRRRRPRTRGPRSHLTPGRAGPPARRPPAARQRLRPRGLTKIDARRTGAPAHDDHRTCPVPRSGQVWMRFQL